MSDYFKEQVNRTDDYLENVGVPPAIGRSHASAGIGGGIGGALVGVIIARALTKDPLKQLVSAAGGGTLGALGTVLWARSMDKSDLREWERRDSAWRKSHHRKKENE